MEAAMKSINELPQEVKAYLLIHIRARRRVALLGAISIAMALALVWTLACCTVDRFWHLSGATRGLLLGVAVVGLGSWLYRPVRRVMEQQIDLNNAAEDIERLRPEFDEKLATVCSRLLGAADQRGSADMLGALAQDVATGIASLPQRALINWRQIRGRLVTLGGLALVIIVLSAIPIIGLPQLLARFAVPWAKIPPVTTTQLKVLDPLGPEVNVMEGQTVAVSVRAQRLGDGVVMLHTSTDGKTWVQKAMEVKAPLTFALSLGPVQKDQWFFVSGGDAVTEATPVRVLRKPAITEFRVRYEYPAYTQRPPLAVSNTDGVIEAPVGSKATLTIVTTEPLRQATFKAQGQELPMQATVEPTVYQATLTILKDQPYRVAMVSMRNMSGEGPESSTIRAIADHAPFVRLVQPAEDLRLNPLDITALKYQAVDDYGVTRLNVQVQVNGDKASDSPAKIVGDPRKQDANFNLDLAKFAVKIGDVLTVTLSATDASGQSATTQARHIFIAPQSVDAAAQMRQMDLEQARRMTDQVLVDLEGAAKAMEEAGAQKDHQSEPFAAADNRYRQNVASSGEDAAVLKQSLLRALNQSPQAKTSDLLAGMVDKAQTRTAEARGLSGELQQDAKRQETAKRRIARGIEQTKEMQQQLKVLAQGEKAAEALADMKNAQAAQAVKPDGKNELAKQMVQRMKEQIAQDAKQVGLNPGDPNLKQQFEQKVAEAKQVAEQARPLDLTPPAKDWAETLPEQPIDRTGRLDSRINAAAEAEAVRPDGDLNRAMDMEVAARAAKAIEQMSHEDSEPARQAAFDAAKAFPAALAAIQQQARNQQPTPSTEDRAVAEAAARAREQMKQWAGDADAAAAAKSEQAKEPSEKAAMQANAEMARGEYAKAAEIDKTMQTPPGNATEAASAMSQAQRLDKLADQQAQLATELDEAAGKNAADVAVGQQELAQEIKKADEQSDDAKGVQRNMRAEALSAIQQSQERLAAMPQQLQQMAQAADVQFQANDQVARLQQEAGAAQGEKKTAAQHAAERGQVAAADAKQRTAETATPVSAEVPKVMAANLQEYAPQTESAIAALQGKLAPALAELKQVVDANDVKGTTRQLTRTREAIAAAQEELRKAQAVVLDQDPLFAAQSYAQVAAKALQEYPPDVRGARQAQSQAAAALSQSWNQAIRQAAGARLGAVPELSSVYAPESPSNAAVAATANLAALREWGRLRQREKDELTTPNKQEDPGGYRQMLQIYFESLGKAKLEGAKP